jgi:hypothetical protein
MSVITDVGGNSTGKNIIGLMVHSTAGMDDGLYPHSTDFKYHLHEMDHTTVEVINLGNISNSKYLHYPNTLPVYLINSDVSIISNHSPSYFQK